MWASRPRVLVLVFALVAGLAWWLSEGTPQRIGPEAVRARSPDYVVVDFSAVETDTGGRPARRLEASELRQYIDENLAELDLPRLVLFEDAGPPWRAEARRGLLLAGGDELRLRDEVRIERAAGPDERPIRFETSLLDIWPERHYAEGDRPVRIDSAGDWLTAAGIRLWYAKPARADFPGRAHLSIAPAAPSDAVGKEHTQ